MHKLTWQVVKTGTCSLSSWGNSFTLVLGTLSPPSCPVLFSLMFNKSVLMFHFEEKREEHLFIVLARLKWEIILLVSCLLEPKNCRSSSGHLRLAPNASESPQTRVTMTGKSRITDQFNTVTNNLRCKTLRVKSDRHKWLNTSSLPTQLTELHLNCFLRWILIQLWHRHGLLCS